MSADWQAIDNAIRAWVVAGTQLPLQSVYWGNQDSARPPGPAVEMNRYAEHTTGRALLDHKVQYVTFAPLTVSGVSTSAGTLTVTAHGFTNGDGPVRIVSTAIVPGGLAPLTDYWVIFVDPNTIKLAKTFVATGGTYVNGAPSGNPVTPIVLTDTGSGTITLVSTAKTLRAGREIQYASRSLERLSLMLQCHAIDGVGLNTAMSILDRLKARQRLPSQQKILKGARLALIECQRARSIHGIRNAVQFEPRAMMEVLFTTPSEEFEFGTIIDRVSGTGRIGSKTFAIS